MSDDSASPIKPVRSSIGWLAGIAVLALLGGCGSDGMGSDADALGDDRAGVEGTRQANATCLILGLVCSGGGSSPSSGGGSDDDAPEVTDPEGSTGAPAVSSAGVDGVYLACGGATRSYYNPFGLARRQNESADKNRMVLDETWSRAAAVQQVKPGPVRILFHQPGGWFGASDDGMRGAIPTVQVMNGRKTNGSKLYGWRWTVWSTELSEAAAAHPDWILALYLSGQVPARSAQDAVDAVQAWEIYDHENDRHRNLMLRVVDQWMAAGVREFVFDGTAKEYYGGDIPKLAVDVRARGGRLYVEGHPRDKEQNLRAEFLAQIDGSLATHRFMVHNEPESLDWIVPEGSTMTILLSTITIPEAPSRSTPTWADVESYRSRGFTILSGKEELDPFLTQ